MGSKLFTYKEIQSTNKDADRLISMGEIENECFVLSEYQTNGKGRAGNVWISEAGKNILMSMVEFPAFLSVEEQFQLSKAVSLGISDFLFEISVPCRIKWPNDILVNSEKIAGILIENSIMGSVIRHSIIGIGLNVNQLNFPEFEYKATSLAKLKGIVFDRDQMTGLLIGKLKTRYGQLERGEYKKIDEDYTGQLFMINEESVFRKGSESIKGTIRGVNESGELLIESGKSLSTYGFHEIKMVY